MRILIFILTLTAVSVSSAQLKKEAPKKQNRDIKATVVFDPLRIMRQAAPGKTITQNIMIKNVIDIEIETEILIKPVYVTKNNDLLREDEIRARKDGVSDYKKVPFPEVIVPNKLFKLQPNQTLSVPIQIKIPDVPVGFYAFGFSAAPTASEYTKISKHKGSPAGIGVHMAIFGVGYISVEGVSKLSIDAEISKSYKNGMLAVSAKVSNSGNDYVRGYVGDAVLLKNGAVVSKFELKDRADTPTLFPGGQKIFMGSTPARLTEGDYDLILNFKDHKSEKMQVFREKIRVQ